MIQCTIIIQKGKEGFPLGYKSNRYLSTTLNPFSKSPIMAVNGRGMTSNFVHILIHPWYGGTDGKYCGDVDPNVRNLLDIRRVSSISQGRFGSCESLCSLTPAGTWWTQLGKTVL